MYCIALIVHVYTNSALYGGEKSRHIIKILRKLNILDIVAIYSSIMLILTLVGESFNIIIVAQYTDRNITLDILQG